MRNFFSKLSYKFALFMQDRHGNDELNLFLTAISFILAILSCFKVMWFLYIPAIVIMVLVLLRFFSKNRYKRQRERGVYLKIREKILKRFRLWRNMWKNRKSVKYCRCKNCKTYVKVPKKVGKIKITCPNCKNTFIKKV